jgi:hypothetical protein
MKTAEELRVEFEQQQREHLGRFAYWLVSRPQRFWVWLYFVMTCVGVALVALNIWEDRPVGAAIGGFVVGMEAALLFINGFLENRINLAIHQRAFEYFSAHLNSSSVVVHIDGGEPPATLQ